MEDWELDFKWLQVRHYVQNAFSIDSLPDLKGILFLIGVQELGEFNRKFSKEEKQDLMHIAVCTLLENDGIYEFEGLDHDGWPHWKQIKPLEKMNVDLQEKLLKERVINYFNLSEQNYKES